MSGAPKPEEFDPTGDLTAKAMLIEASAGTGKTYSITNVFLRLVIEPELTLRWPGDTQAAPKEILVVTFTEAATADMRERIRSRLREARTWLEHVIAGQSITKEDDEVLHFLVERAGGVEGLNRARNRVQLALESFDEITISTIHGFCQRMLMRNAFESGTEFDCELQADLGALVEDAILDYWVARTHDETRDRLGMLQGKQLGGLAAVRRLAKVVLADPDLKDRIHPKTWTPFDPAAWKAWRDAVDRFRAAWDEHSEVVTGILLKATVAGGPMRGTSYQDTQIEGRARAVANWLDETRLGNYDPGPDDPKDSDLAFNKIGFYASAKVRAAQKQPVDLPWPLFEAADQVLELAPSARASIHGFLMEFRVGLIRHVLEAVEERKTRAHVQGFEDLLRRLRDGLHPDRTSSEVLRRAIAGQFRIAIIDEFQDTDPVQWEIFETVFLGRRDAPRAEGVRGDDRGRLFLVGDPKQAIYAFRGADLDTYLVARDRTVQRTLSWNHRSDGRLVAAMNRLYRVKERQAEEDDGNPFLRSTEVEYIEVKVPPKHRDDRWIYPASWHKRPLRIGLLDRNGSPDQIRAEDARQWVSRWVADDIVKFLDPAGGAMVRKDPEKPDLRPVQPRDVAVLVRSHRQGRAIERAMRQVGIPCVRRGQESVFDTDEAQHLRWFLEAVIAPGDRTAVRTALATSIGGLTADQVLALEKDEQELETRTQELEGWGETWRKHGLMRMVREVLDAHHVTTTFLSWSDGERRLTNLLHLAEILHDASKRLSLKPEALVAWVRRQMAGEVGEGDPDARLLRLESDADAAQIVTVHGCKGLQYPFVWCPFLWDGFVMHPEEGRFPRFHEEDRRMSINIAREAADLHDTHRKLARAERQAEMQRHAYVALTRARYATTVVTGAAWSVEESPLAILLHQERKEGKADGTTVASRLEALKARMKGISDADLQADIDAIVNASATDPDDPETQTIDGVSARDPADAGELARYQPSTQGRPEEKDLQIEAWPGWHPSDPCWRWSSFSSLVKKAQGKPDGTKTEPAKTPEGGDAPATSTPAAIQPAESVIPGVALQDSTPALVRGDRGEEAEDEENETRDCAGPVEDDIAPPAAGAAAADGPGTVAVRFAKVVPLDEFPRGAEAGTFMHSVFEELVKEKGFRDADDDLIRRIVGEQRDFHGLLPKWQDPFVEAVDQILKTPLGVIPGTKGDRGPTLRDLPKENCLAELSFNFPALGGLEAPSHEGHTVYPVTLGQAFEKGDSGDLPDGYAGSLKRLGFAQFRGFLKGVIDLVFRWNPSGKPGDERWFVLDYKSNRLLASREQEKSLFGDYTPDRLEHAMVHHDYILQYHLYTLAVHRHLAWRLGGRYDYERDFGGAYYLFVRGMQGKDPAGDTGVFRTRPPFARIQALSDLFGEPARPGEEG